MAAVGDVIEILGRGTSISASVDSIAGFGGDSLEKLNTSAQLASAGAGLLSSVNPGAAISAGLFAADVQLAKFYNDVKYSAGITTYAADIVGFIGDIAVIGGGVSTFVGAPAVGAAFGALGATTDVAGIALNHPEQVVDAVDKTISAISAAGSSTLDALGKVLSSAKDIFNNAAGPTTDATKITVDALNNLSQSADQNFTVVANSAGIVSVSGTYPEDGKAPQVEWTDSNGKIHDFVAGSSGYTQNTSASGHDIIIGSGTSASITGDEDQITLQGDSGTSLNLSGKNHVVTGDSGSDVVSLDANTSATVSGGGNIVLNGDNAAVTANENEKFNITVSSGVKTGIIHAKNSTINLPSSWQDTVDGEGNTINQALDSSPSPQPSPAPAPDPQPNPAPAPDPQPNPAPAPDPQPNPRLRPIRSRTRRLHPIRSRTRRLHPIRSRTRRLHPIRSRTRRLRQIHLKPPGHRLRNRNLSRPPPSLRRTRRQPNPHRTRRRPSLRRTRRRPSLRRTQLPRVKATPVRAEIRVAEM